jgi:hypothetical protein
MQIQRWRLTEVVVVKRRDAVEGFPQASVREICAQPADNG